MKIILLDNVIGLGRAGDIKVVKDGYARNYLLPKKLAEVATEAKEKYLQRKAAKLAEKAKKIFETATQLKNDIENKVIEFKAKVGEEGKLYGSITNADIALKLKEMGYDIDKRKIITPHLKLVGEYKVRIRLDEGVEATIVVKVAGE